MSVTLDANILVYASNKSDPVHAKARDLLESLATGSELVYLFWPVIMGYLRIVTHPAILPSPLNFAQAVGNITKLFALPQIQVAGEGEGFWDVYQAVASKHARGNEIPDTQLVALMHQYGVRVIYTRDRDFNRFDGVSPRNPIDVKQS